MALCMSHLSSFHLSFLNHKPKPKPKSNPKPYISLFRWDSQLPRRSISIATCTVRVPPTPEPESTVIIVGAGPSGLATAACLARDSVPYILLEREDCVASLWKKKAYDRLHLHLAKPFCQLPHFPFPQELPKYVSRNDFLRYIDDYVNHFQIAPLYHRTVTLARYDEGLGRWRVRVSGEEEEYVGRFLVVATGETCDAYMPDVEGLGGFKGKVVHSTEYKSGKEYRDKAVLVVGSGNSGMEIALDLANYGATTSLVVRSPVHILSRGMMYMGVNLVKFASLNVVDSLMVILSKLVYRDFSKYGMTRPKDGPFLTKAKYGKFPIIDVGTFGKIQAGEIQVLPAVASFRGNEVMFENGKSYAFDAIIFATGFRSSTNKWLQGDDYLLNEDGQPKPSFPNHWKGKQGLYCAGFAGRGLYGAGTDAQNISNDIKARIN